MSKHLKMLFIFKLHGAGIDGVSDYLDRLVRAFERKGHQAEILTGKESDFFKKIKESGAKAINFQYVPQAYSRLGITFRFTWALFVSRFFFHKKVVITFHEVYEPVYFRRPFRWPFALLQRLQLFLFLIISNQAIFTTPVFLPRIERIFPFWKNKIHCLPVFSNIPKVEFPEEDKLYFRKRWGIASDALVLGVFSKTLHEALNLEMLFHIAENLTRRGIPACVFLIGAFKESNPNYFKKLQILAEKFKIKPLWTGALSSHDVSLAFQVMNFYMGLWPGGASPRSTTFMTALDHGLPVIVTQSPQMHLYSDFEACVVSVDLLDEENVVRAILKCRDNRIENDLKRQKARLFYQRYFGSDQIAEKVQGLL